jgi:1-acyl-sn-glycerol-3-phosphate acyltransferase
MAPRNETEMPEYGWRQHLRAGAVLAGFIALTLPLMPLQAALLKISPDAARRLPHWYHRRVCRLLGLRFQIDGAIVQDQPVLVVANHTSWLDIPVLSAVGPVAFIAKREVGGWPFVGALARLQRTVFVDRTRRTAVGATADEMSARLRAGDALVLFAEGTSTDGNRVGPFSSSLFGAVLDRPTAPDEPAIAIQTLTLAYTRVHGIPLGRADRPLVGWYGDMELGPHAWRLLGAGPLDVSIKIGPPVAAATLGDRKAVARHTQAAVLADLVRLLRCLPSDHPLTVASIDRAKPKERLGAARAQSSRWT